jgi:hypothetical protein
VVDVGDDGDVADIGAGGHEPFECTGRRFAALNPLTGAMRRDVTPTMYP